MLELRDNYIFFVLVFERSAYHFQEELRKNSSNKIELNHTHCFLSFDMFSSVTVSVGSSISGKY